MSQVGTNRLSNDAGLSFRPGDTGAETIHLQSYERTNSQTDTVALGRSEAKLRWPNARELPQTATIDLLCRMGPGPLNRAESPLGSGQEVDGVQFVNLLVGPYLSA